MAIRRTQPTLFSTHRRLKDHEPRREHGGGIRKGRRKLARPIHPRKPMHLTLRSSRATAALSMLRPVYESRIRALVHKHAAKNGIQIRQYANSGNHLHLLIRTKTRTGFQHFLKTISGLIARLVTGAIKGRAQGKFWDDLAYTRIVEWGRDLENSTFYVILNEMEANGVWSRKIAAPPQPQKTSRRP